MLTRPEGIRPRAIVVWLIALALLVSVLVTGEAGMVFGLLWIALLFGLVLLGLWVLLRRWLAHRGDREGA